MLSNFDPSYLQEYLKEERDVLGDELAYLHSKMLRMEKSKANHYAEVKCF
jgi:hypothetical protein